ncbi:hypothetical protein BDV10DRAFT_119149 [Aspergillus recurvatus]
MDPLLISPLSLALSLSTSSSPSAFVFPFKEPACPSSFQPCIYISDTEYIPYHTTGVPRIKACLFLSFHPFLSVFHPFVHERNGGQIRSSRAFGCMACSR